MSAKVKLKDGTVVTCSSEEAAENLRSRLAKPKSKKKKGEGKPTKRA